MDADEVTARLATCKDMLASRTASDGKPKPGYRRNVAAIKREITKLSALPR